MGFLCMKEDVGYEEFLAAIYEAETEGSEGKVLNVKAKAMAVEKIIDSKEQNEIKDLKQQIESLTMIMKSATIGNVKSRAVRRDFFPKKEGNAQKFSSEKGFKGQLKGGRDL